MTTSLHTEITQILNSRLVILQCSQLMLNKKQCRWWKLHWNYETLWGVWRALRAEYAPNTLGLTLDNLGTQPTFTGIQHFLSQALPESSELAMFLICLVYNWSGNGILNVCWKQDGSKQNRNYGTPIARQRLNDFSFHWWSTSSAF